MFTNKHYVSAIKWKRGERSALAELSEEQLKNITPLIEIQPMTYNHSEQTFNKSVDEHLEKFAEEVLSFWSKNLNRPLFLDIFTLFEDYRIPKKLKTKNGETPLEFLLEESKKNDILIIPVIKIPLNALQLDILKSVFNKQSKRLALRIDINYFNNLEEITKVIDAFLDLSNFEPKDIDLILVYEKLEYAKRNNYVEEIRSLISLLPHLKSWKSFTFLSTSMPEDLSHLKSGNNSTIPRIEWGIYNELIESGVERIPTYGDYNVNNPAWFDFNPRIMQVGANIKYTSHNDFLIFRGHGVRNNGFKQYHKLSLETKNHSDYLGKDFS